jgi:hypothetical protein
MRTSAYIVGYFCQAPKGSEGIALWLGDRRDDGTAVVSHIVRLRGAGIRKSPLNITIEPRLLREVHHTAKAESAVLVGQIHSHGLEFGVDLSAPRPPEFFALAAEWLGIESRDLSGG